MANVSTCLAPQPGHWGWHLVSWGRCIVSLTGGRDTLGHCVSSEQVAPCPGQGHAQTWHVPVAAGHGVVTPAPLVLHGNSPTPCLEPPQGWSRCHLPVPPISVTVPPPVPRLLLCQPEPSPQG